jgi:hypothetical protein
VAQLRAWAAAVGVPPRDVLFVGDSLRDAAIARDAGFRFVGLSRPGHPDAFVASGVPVVTSLTNLALVVARTRRSPVTVTIPAGAVDPSGPEPLTVPVTAPFKSADLAGAHQPIHVFEDKHRYDGAVDDHDVPADVGSRSKRPGDLGPLRRNVGRRQGGG